MADGLRTRHALQWKSRRRPPVAAYDLASIDVNGLRAIEEIVQQVDAPFAPYITTVAAGATRDR
jgi:hypothetical protein